MTPERLVGLLVLLLPVMSALGVGAFHATKWFVERRDKIEHAEPTVQPIQGMAVTAIPETPLERERGKRIDQLEEDLDEARDELRRATAERALYREVIARHGWEFADLHPTPPPHEENS